MKECNCPEYIQRCVHFDGLALWYTARDFLRAETVRRGLSDGAPCPGCGKPWNIIDYAAVVIGPGRVDNYLECTCRFPMSVTSPDSETAAFADEGEAAEFFAMKELALLGKNDR